MYIQDRNIITKGISTVDSISFSTKNVIACGKFNKDNLIKVSLSSPENKEEKNIQQKTFKFYKKHKYIFFVIFSLIAYFLNIYCKSILTFFYTILVADFAIDICTNLSNENLAKNHAAEHMTLNAFEKTNQVPTINEVKNSSMFHINCGCRLSGIYVFLYFVSLIINYYMPIITITYILANFKLFKYLGFPVQYLLVSKPDNKNIELAISAINEVLNYSK